MTHRATVAVRLTVDEQRRLDELSARTGRSRSFYVREAIQLHLRDLEERYWEDEVVQEWENSKQATRPAAELWSELGL
jgi:RHH-type rel operon transcriptional repressor/antitoxin RelB